MADPAVVREHARDAAIRLATQRLPVFLQTSPLEVLVGIAVAVLGVLSGGLMGSALVGLGVLLVAWTTATGIASARTAAQLEEASGERLDGLAQRLLVVEEQLTGAARAPQEEVRAALLDQARRSLAYAVAGVGVQRESPVATAAHLDAPPAAQLDAPPAAQLDAPPAAHLDAPPAAHLLAARPAQDEGSASAAPRPAQDGGSAARDRATAVLESGSVAPVP